MGLKTVRELGMKSLNQESIPKPSSSTQASLNQKFKQMKDLYNSILTEDVKTQPNLSRPSAKQPPKRQSSLIVNYNIV